METITKATGLKKKRNLFGWVFLASVIVFIFSNPVLMIGPQFGMQIIDYFNPVAPNSGTSGSTLMNTAVVVSMVSLLTSITSLIGFLSTTVLAWRKDKRESASAELEIKKKELELEKLKIELSKTKDPSRSDIT